MIPTAGFGPERTWDWCFDGLPHHSTVAVTTNGTLDDPEARRLEAFEQVEADNAAYQKETHRPGKVIILSFYPDIKTAYKTVFGGYRKAKSKGYVKGDVELMHNGKIYTIGGM